MKGEQKTEIELKAILCGVGGQGVIFMTRLIAQTAMDLGCSVIASETHGMSQRGGSVLSHLKINGTEAPLIRRGTADVMLALDSTEALRGLPWLRSGSLAFINNAGEISEKTSMELENLGIGVHSITAGATAMELGSPAIANVVLIGFASAFPEFSLPYHSFENTLKSLAPRGLELNIEALRSGYEAGQSYLKQRDNATTVLTN
jgi:indolepyruvate ferredoxin oxidoreductase beta subunit